MLFANPAACRTLDVALRDIVGSELASVLHSRAAVERLLAASHTGSEQRLRVEIRPSAPGDEAPARPFSAAARALPPENGSGRRTLIVLHDLSAHSQVESELREKNHELEQYVHNVTHDLRSPLVSLLGFSRLLRQEYGDRLDDAGRHFVDRIEQASRTMETLINDLLELSRAESRRDRRAHANALDVLIQLQAELKPRLENLGVRLQLPSNPVVVLCDRTRLYQVFSNLIGNALDHMGGCVEPVISIEIRETLREHLLVVRDNGRGVPAGEQERIFELFHSAGTRSDGSRGTGVGLAIVKKIALSQGGRAWVESTPGEGAAFHVSLPRT